MAVAAIVDAVASAGASLSQHRLRASLTALGVVFGVMAVIAVVAIVEGVFQVYRQQLDGLGAGFMIATPGNSKALDRVRRNARLTPEDGEALAVVSGMRAVSPYFFDRRQMAHHGSTADAGIMPALPNYPLIQNHVLAEGRFFSAAEERSRARVVVLGPQLCEQLGLRAPLGEQVRLYGAAFTVIGVMEAKPGLNALGHEFDTAAVVPYSTALSFRTAPRGTMLLIKLATVDDVEFMKEQTRGVLRKQHRLARDEPDDFELMTQGEIVAKVEEIGAIATWVVLAVVSVALLVGGIGIMNIMLVSVTERTREIGIRRAHGARRRDILWQFLLEASVLGAVGGVLGILLGIGVAHLIAAVIPGFPSPSVPLWSVALGFGFATAVGLVFGLYPAIRAARIHVVDALRFE
jgi:putative ABC transport system permease protein